MTVALAGDIGGTKLAAGVVRHDGVILARCAIPTPRSADADGLYQAFLGLLLQALAQSGVECASVQAIGIGCGGPMEYAAGVVSPLNIPAWRGFPLRARLERDFGLRTLVDNDAKVFALGEHWLGSGRDARCLLAMVVSTGVGGGVVENGQLINGARGNAGHIGHVIVFPDGPLCACGAQGCLEAVASGTALALLAREAVESGQPSSLPESPTARDLEAAAAAGDELALRLFRQAGIGIGRGIAAAAALFDLDRVVIGGGVSNASQFFLSTLRYELDIRARLDFARGLPVEISTGTIDAALAGAARLVLATA
jgi:glucokinase